jgi:DNA-directed RNA polymerase I, II, and III subunit RPABC1
MLKQRLSDIEINSKGKTKIILKNILIMLSNRGFVDKAAIEATHKKLLNDVSDDMIFKIPSNSGDFQVKFILKKLTTIKRIPKINKFLYENTDTNKIVVVTNINQKTYKQFIEHQNIEVFWDYELMIDKVSHHFVPDHHVLNKEEHDAFFEAYKIKKINIPKIKVSDPIARYYKMQVGDIVKITRTSITTGHSIMYRCVVMAPPFKF